MKRVQIENGKISFRQAIYNFWIKYFDFRGIATRREYWYCWIFMLLVNIVFSFTGAIVGSVVGSIMLIPRWTLSVRRFHDVGLPGYLYFVPALCILIWFAAREGLWLRFAAMGFLLPEFMAFLLFLAVVMVFNLIVFCWPSRVVAKKSGRK